MKIISHGHWTQYTPNPRPGGLPDNVRFTKRDNDGVDWYEYKNNPDNFNADAIFMVCYYRNYEESYVVSPSTDDVTTLFPNKQYVIEVIGYNGDPVKDFENKLYDPETNTVSANKLWDNS